MSTPTSARPDYYVPLPQRLLDDLRDSPLAVGVYTLVARLFRATRAAVPLSPADLRAFDERLSYGAATRALQRLVGAGYLIAARQRGHKSTYSPSWGRVAGTPRPWDLAAACLGRPRHLREVRLPQRLLDTFLGRLDPHPLHPARVTRYITTPLLGLADVGVYGLALAGLPGASPALAALGLANDAGLPAPLPDDASILALASQRRLWDDGSPLALSAAGWARTAFAAPPAPDSSAAGGQPLFFVPMGQIAQPIAAMIAPPISGEPSTHKQNPASQRPRGRAVPAASGSHVGRCKKEIETTVPETVAQAGGGTIDTSGPQLTESERRLRDLGVRAEVAQSLRDRPVAAIDRLAAQAQARPDVRDRAAWVVSALRALPAEPPAAPAPRVSDLAILTHPGLTNSERTRWLTRFRNADLVDRPALLARFHQEHAQERSGA